MKLKPIKCRKCRRNIGARLQKRGWPLDGYCPRCTTDDFDVCLYCDCPLHSSILAKTCPACHANIYHNPAQRVLGIIFHEFARDLDEAKQHQDNLVLAAFLCEAYANAMRLANDIINHRPETAEEHMERIRYLSHTITQQFHFPRNIAAEWEIRIQPPKGVDKPRET